MGTSISTLLTVVTPPATNPPGPIGSLTPSTITTAGLSLSWTAPATGTAPFSYQVQQAFAGTPPVWVNIGGLQNTTGPFVVTGLSPFTQYQFQVVVSNATGNNTSPTIQVTTLAIFPTAPGTPTFVSAGTTDISLAWTAPATLGVPALTSYTVLQRTPTGSGAFGSPVATPTAAAAVDVTGLVPGTSYDFEVQANTPAGAGPLSGVLLNVSTASLGVLPSAPQNLLTGAAANITNTSIRVAWSAPAVGTTPITYILQWSPTGLNQWTSNPSTSALASTVTGLSIGTVYDFQVIPHNIVGTGTTSAIFTTATNLVNVSIPTPPLNLTVTQTGVTTVNLAWSPPAGGSLPVLYALQWSPTGANIWTTGVSVYSTYGQISGLVAGTVYDFRVSATNPAGTSPFSSVLIGVTTLASLPVVGWNPTGAVGPLTFSNSNQTVATGGTATVGSTSQGCLCGTPMSTGKFAIQISSTALTANVSYGLANLNYTVGVFGPTGTTTNNIEFFLRPTTGAQAALTMYHNQVLVLGPSLSGGNGEPAVSTTTILVDTDADLWWVQSTHMISVFGAGVYNDNVLADPANGIGGIPTQVLGDVFLLLESGESGASVTLNAGSSAFSGATAVPFQFMPLAGGTGTVTRATAVTSVTPTATDTTVALTWAVPATATRPVTYEVTIRLSGLGNFVPLFTTTTPSATVTGLQPNTAYDFQILPSSAGGNAGATITATITTLPPQIAPSPPLGLQSTATTSNSVTISWQPPATGTPPFTYTPQHKLTNTVTWPTTSDLPTTSTSTTISGLLGSTSYDFRLTASNLIGTSAPSSPALTAVTQSSGVLASRIADLMEMVSFNVFPSNIPQQNLFGSFPAEYTVPSVVAAYKFMTGTTAMIPQTRIWDFNEYSTLTTWCPTFFLATGSIMSLTLQGAIGVGTAIPDLTTLATESHNGSGNSAGAAGWLQYSEGWNEPNGVGSDTSAQTAAGDQARLAALSGFPEIELITASIVFALTNPEKSITGYYAPADLVTVQNCCTIWNVHYYPTQNIDFNDHDLGWPTTTRGGEFNDVFIGHNVGYGSQRSQAITEWHPTLYHKSNPNFSKSGWDDAHDSYLTWCYIMSAFRLNYIMISWYALYDFATAFSTGLWVKDARTDTPRATAYVFRAMYQLLGELSQAGKRTFAPGSLNYSITNLPGPAFADSLNSGGHHMLFQNSSGRFGIFVWNSQQAPGGTAVNVTINFATPVGRVVDYNITANPAQNLTPGPQAAGSVSTFTFPLAAEGHIILVDTVSVATFPPGPPLGLSVTAKTTTSISISAFPPCSTDGIHANTYTYQISPAGANTFVTATGGSGLAALTFTFPGLTTGTSYDMRMFANNPNGGSLLSAVLTATTS